MDQSADKGSKENENSQKLDLSDLQNFNFASNWSESFPTTARPKGGRESRHAGGDRRSDRRPPGAREHRTRGAESRDGAPPPGRGDRRRSERPARREERPERAFLNESPFEVQIFAEEATLSKLANAMRHSLRTYELFEISRLVLEKPDRFQIGMRYLGKSGGGEVLYQSVPDGLPFLSEEAAVDHVFRTHLEKFFTVEEVEVDPPKGSFQFIARCTRTGEFLSPPNYHRYQSILLQFHQERFPDIPFERFRSQIETVKDEEAIQKWLESMKKQTRYRLAGSAEGEGHTLESPEQARAYLLRSVKDKVVRAVKSVRFSGQQIENLSSPDIRPYVVAHVEHQKRFPLDTSNILRGRLRRQHFFIYKKGSRGISFVCAVKRKFRQPQQVFSDSVQTLISFLEQNDQIYASQLPEKFLGIPAPAEGEEAAPLDSGSQEKIKRLNLDLRWLLSEGYVTEFSDGRLSVHPVAQPEREEASRKAPTSGDDRSSDKPREAEAVAGDASQAGGEVEKPAPAEVDGSENPVDASASAENTEGAPSGKTEADSAKTSGGEEGVAEESGVGDGVDQELASSDHAEVSPNEATSAESTDGDFAQNVAESQEAKPVEGVSSGTEQPRPGAS